MSLGNFGTDGFTDYKSRLPFSVLFFSFLVRISRIQE
jgi:hypothetical protein